jgi:ParB-like chromosome segregation protein Spo0J
MDIISNAQMGRLTPSDSSSQQVEPNLTQLVTRKVADLIRYSHNPRKHSEAQVAQIAASIAEFGFTNPVLIDEKNSIIAGEGRVLAAKKAKMTTVPCVVLTGLTDAQKAAYVVADNKLALNSGWDEGTLQAELDRLADLNIDLNLTGFSEVEIAALLDNLDTDVEDFAGIDFPATPTESTEVEELEIEVRATQPDSTGAEEPAIKVVATEPGTTQPEAQKAWQGMPDFNQPDGGPFRTIRVHCIDQAAVNAFAKLIGQKLTDRTKGVWFPQAVKNVAGVVYA